MVFSRNFVQCGEAVLPALGFFLLFYLPFGPGLKMFSVLYSVAVLGFSY